MLMSSAWRHVSMVMTKDMEEKPKLSHDICSKILLTKS